MKPDNVVDEGWVPEGGVAAPQMEAGHGALEAAGRSRSSGSCRFRGHEVQVGGVGEDVAAVRARMGTGMRWCGQGRWWQIARMVAADRARIVRGCRGVEEDGGGGSGEDCSGAGAAVRARRTVAGLQRIGCDSEDGGGDAAARARTAAADWARTAAARARMAARVRRRMREGQLRG